MQLQARRYSALFIALALVVTLLPVAMSPAGAAGTFDDDDGNVHESAIEQIAAAGITRGCNPPQNNLYCPDDHVTRAQMASFLVRTFDLPAGPEGQFEDTAGSVHESDIEALAASGITRGCNPPDNDRYCPDDVVTRGQMAAFMARGLDLDNAAEDFFGDDDNSIFEAQINAIAQIGITRGCNPPDNTQYCPDDPVRRDEMASFLSRVDNILTTGTTSTTTPGSSTTSTSSTTTTTLPGTGRNLFLGADAGRQPAVFLDGETVSGDVYIFAGPDDGVTQTRFYLDDPNPDEPTGNPYRVEDFSRFDLEGTAPNDNARPFDTFWLKNGQHTVTAVMEIAAGGTETYVADFTVDNQPGVWLGQRSESFSLEPGNASDDPKGVEVDSNNGSAISWNASITSGNAEDWLTLVNNSGTGGDEVTFDASAVGLTPGIRTATVAVAAGGFRNTSFTVTMNVLAVGECPSPHGEDVAVGLPFSTTFTATSGSVEDADGEATGFTCVQATTNGEGYKPANLALDPSAGTLSISTTGGIAFESVNSQDNTLGVGFDGSTQTVITTTLNSPPWQGDGGFEQAGIWAGIHEDTFVKGVLIDTPDGNALQVQSESLGNIVQTAEALLPGPAPSTLALQLTIREGPQDALLRYSVDGGPLQSVTPRIDVPAGVFNGVDPDGAEGPSGVNTMAGIFATHRNGTQKTYTFGDFSVAKP